MRLLNLLVTVTALLAPSADTLAAQVAAPAEPDLEARVWLDRGDEPVLHRGDHVRVYYRTSEDAFAAIFRIDTDGLISLVLPQHPEAEQAVTGARDFRLLFPQSPVWIVEEDPGVGYLFMVASPEPLDFSGFDFDPEGGWDLSVVGSTVYDDPYVAIDDYVAVVVPNWEEAAYALDFLSYNVGERYSYPRFLCYDCHGPQSYPSWNPYSLNCSSYRVVIWDDPYFYPSYRYAGTRLVLAQRPRALPRYGVTVRATAAGTRPIVRSRAAPVRRVVEYKEPPGGPTPAQRIRRPRTAVPRGGAADARAASARPTLQRRPSGAAASYPLRTPPASATRAPSNGAGRAVTPRARGGGADPRIVRPDAPGARGARAGTVPDRPSSRAANARPSGSATRRAPGVGSSPDAGGARARPGGRPDARARAPATARPRAGARAPSRPSARPSTARPSSGRGPAARAPSGRPTVRARPTTRRRR